MERQLFNQLVLRHHSIAITIALAISFSTFTLWLVASPIKYTLFGFEIFAIIVIYLVLISNNGNGTGLNLSIFTKSRRWTLGRFRHFFFETILVVSSIVLVILNSLHIEAGEGTIQLGLAFISTSILSGYILLNIFKLKCYFSKLEILVLSYLLSFILSGFSTLALLSVHENIRAVIIPIFFIIAAVVSGIRRVRDRDSASYGPRPNSLSRNIDALALSLSIIFYAVFFHYIYPNFALLPGSDILVNHNYSVVLSRSPELYTGFHYILFHSYEATLAVLSGFHQSIVSFQTIQVALNLFLPLIIYIFAKRFLGDLDKRIPALATLFYSILSNFSFIYFSQLKLLSQGSSGEIQILGQDVAEKAYNGTINFLQPFPWFVPLSISFVMFLTAFLLLKADKLPKSRFMPLYCTLILAMYLTHVTEAVIFVIFLAVYSFFARTGKDSSLRLDDALLSSLLAFGIATLFVVYTFFFWKSYLFPTEANFWTFLPLILPLAVPIISVGLSIVWRWKVLPKIWVRSGRVIHNGKKLYPLLSTLLVSTYLFGFLTWIFIENFKTSAVYNVGVAPWFIYPVMLGIVGLLALLGIRYLVTILPNQSVTIILVSVLVMFLMGKIVSYVNLNFISTGYWEKRFLILIYPFVSVLAPLALLKFNEEIQMRVRPKLLSNTFLIVVICVIMISGFSSMVLQTVYWFTNVNNSPNRLGNKELQAIDYLRGVLQHDTHAFVISPSGESRNILEFADPVYQLPLPQLSLFSKYPEIPLLTLASHNLNHAYIYVDARDSDILDKEPKSWLVRHLLSLLPVVYSNRDVTIYNSSHVSFPLPRSNTTVLMPRDYPDSSWLYAIDSVSQSGKNYTVMYDDDPGALNSKTVILSYDPNQYPTFYDKFTAEGNPNSFPGSSFALNVISGNWNYATSGLNAGDSLNRLENVMLSQVTTNNFTASTSFKIDNANPAVPNYVSIVYSWKNSENYEYAGIITRNETVYVSFATVSNGVRSFQPSWPGLNTGLTLKPHNVLNLTLSVKNDPAGQNVERELFLNGTKFLKNTYHRSDSGNIGLSYGRVKGAVFDYFKIQERSKLNLRNTSDYMKFVKSGGHLVVLSTNGYGSIAGSLRDFSEQSSIERSQVMSISSLSIPNKSLRANDSSIFVAQASLGKGKITYINMHKILSSYFGKKIAGPVVYTMLGTLASLVNLQPDITLPPSFNDIEAIFKQVNGTGTIRLDAPTISFPAGMEFSKVVIKTSDNDYTSIWNASKLYFDGYRYATLWGGRNHSISIANGSGLYSVLTMGGTYTDPPIKISFNSNTPTTLTATSNKGNSVRFENVSDIYIVDHDPIRILTRQPTIRINDGTMRFSELYSGPTHTKGITMTGQDLIVKGDISLGVLMSDSYTLGSRIQIDGSVYKIPPVSQFNELTSFMPPLSLSKLYSMPELVRALILLPFLIAVIFILFSRHSKPIHADT